VYAQVVTDAKDALHSGNNKTYLKADADFSWTPGSKKSLKKTNRFSTNSPLSLTDLLQCSVVQGVKYILNKIFAEH
jgi:hypothetical protein